MKGKWLVILEGAELDLKELFKFNPPPEIEIEKRDGNYCLSSEKFNLCKDVREIETIGKEVINVLNGIARLNFQNWKNIDFDKPIFIDERGKIHHFFLVESGQMRLRGGTINFLNTDADGHIISNSEPTIEKSTFEVASRDSRVEKALRIYGSREHSWANLYILYEIIETDIGGKHVIVNNGWTSKSKIENFKHTANSSKAIGDDARHHDEIKNSPAKPISLSEAKDLITDLLKKWIRTK